MNKRQRRKIIKNANRKKRKAKITSQLAYCKLKPQYKEDKNDTLLPKLF